MAINLFSVICALGTDRAPLAIACLSAGRSNFIGFRKTRKKFDQLDGKHDADYRYRMKKRITLALG